MEVIVYHKDYDRVHSMDNFLRFVYSSQMKYFASDLLNKGLSPSEIGDATRRAMLIAKAAGVNVTEHFMPMYTQFVDGIIKDCKLTRLGYSLVLMNARPDITAVGKWQLQVLKKYFGAQF